MTLIGISNCRKLEDYKQSILHVGGEVRVLDQGMTPADALAGIGGLMLTGGTDVDPARYGEATDPSVVDVDAARDEFEIGLILEARRRELPILAICRGIQILNVAAGGTLFQDIPTQMKGALEHQLPVPQFEPYALAHEVWLDKDTLLARLMVERLRDTDSCDVNSRHHQAIKQLAPGLRSTATAPDGVIEAVEAPEAAFVLGVQWHPENFWRTGEFRPLFEGFVEAGSRRL
jgi:putative glutamine amidotransferase